MPAQSIRLGARPTQFDGSSTTRLFAVIGHPVSHSLSPRFQNAALQAMGMDASYLAVDVAPDELAACVQRMRAAAREGRLGGVNVTVPHKAAIAAYLDELDEQAQGTGAVNTICMSQEGGVLRMLGRNTDVDGILAALGDAGVSMRAVGVVVLGSGGAARAAVWAALRDGAAAICVLARRPERAQEMLDHATAHWSGALGELCACDLRAPPALPLQRARVMIQATSLGLREDDPSPVSLDALPQQVFVLELIYHRESALLRQARQLGVRAVGGLGMLVHQGAASLQAWTGREPPLGVMKRSLGL